MRINQTGLINRKILFTCTIKIIWSPYWRRKKKIKSTYLVN